MENETMTTCLDKTGVEIVQELQQADRVGCAERLAIDCRVMG